MRAKDAMIRQKIGRLCFLTIFFLFFSWGGSASGQESRRGNPQKAPAQAAQEKEFTIQVSVDEVRIDAVVVDKNGKQVTNLTADDFEIYQDGQSQRITFCKYISSFKEPSQVPLDSSKKQPAPLVSTPMATAEQVQRTIAFVVDDLSMTFEQVHYARMALRKFIETQMQPGDLVAILRTGTGVGAMQMFSSDRRQLLSVVNDVRWNGAFQALLACSGGG
jgi:VWFA-related protein